MASSVPHIKIRINPDNAKPEISRLIKSIRPKWPTEQLRFRAFEEGLTNILYGVFYDDEDAMVLVRIFGPNSEQYISREMERKAIKFLMQHDMAATLYATFDNGNVYAYIPGRLLLNQDVRVPAITDLVAEEIGKLHALPVPRDQYPETRSFFLSSFEKLIAMLPKQLDDPKDNERYQSKVLSFDFHKELQDMEEMVKTFDEDMVMVHHDLLEANIILTPDEKRVRFIDFEYTTLDYGSIDIAVFFIVYLNILDLDPVKYPYPTRDEQMRFLTKYLRSRYPGREVTEALLESWYKRVNKMAAMAWLYWGLWCVLNAFTSAIDFDFLGLGISELEEYKKLKPKVINL